MSHSSEHIRFLPKNWGGNIAEGYRRIASAVNSIIYDDPQPARWEDYTADFNSARVTGASQPTWTAWRDGIYQWAFDNSTNNELHISIHILHGYHLGSMLYPHIHWTADATAAATGGTVRWGIEYTIAKGHQQAAFPASTTIYLEQVVDSTAFTHHIVEAAEGNGIDGTSVEPDCMLIARVFRDAAHVNDTINSGTVFGHYADLHVQNDRRGGTINRAPNFYEA